MQMYRYILWIKQRNINDQRDLGLYLEKHR